MGHVRQLGSSLLDKVQHDGLGHHVDHGSLHNVIVGRDEKLCRGKLVTRLYTEF